MSRPIDKIAKAIWGSSIRQHGNRKEFLSQVDDLVGKFGLIDGLMPTWRVFKHNDPNTPGEMRVKLAAKGVVSVLVWFAEAPSVRIELHVPSAEWNDDLPIVETKVLPQVLPQLVRALIHNAMVEAAKKRKGEKPKFEPKLVLPP